MYCEFLEPHFSGSSLNFIYLNKVWNSSYNNLSTSSLVGTRRAVSVSYNGKIPKYPEKNPSIRLGEQKKNNFRADAGNLTQVSVVRGQNVNLSASRTARGL